MRNGLVVSVLLCLVTALQGCSVWREHAVHNWSDVTGGESLERNFWKEVKAKNWNELSRHLAGNYISVTPEEGRMDRAATVEHLKQLRLDDYSLGDFQIELNGQTLVVTYTIALRGTYAEQPLPSVPVRMITVWQQQNGGWMALAHSVMGAVAK
jgi:ketosteroid isomerase-like protein